MCILAYTTPYLCQNKMIQLWRVPKHYVTGLVIRSYRHPGVHENKCPSSSTTCDDNVEGYVYVRIRPK